MFTRFFAVATLLQVAAAANSCRQIGCNAGYEPSNDCQCDENCESYGNCCSDYESVCSDNTCRQRGCGTYNPDYECQWEENSAGYGTS